MSSCPLRHYYISQVESDEKQRWQQSKNAALEMLVLKWIVQRETLLEVVAKEAQESQQRFQQHTRASQYQDVEELLNLCNVLRLMTVRVYEAIQVWRDDAMKCGWMALEHEAEVGTHLIMFSIELRILKDIHVFTHLHIYTFIF